jgi:O-antigen/teichoic acid export membrane protein
LIKKFKQYSIVNLISTSISFVLFYVLIKLQIQYLGIENRGILILIQASVGLLATIVRFGINQAVLHELTIGKNDKVLSNFYLLSFFQMIIFLMLVYCIQRFNILIDLNYGINLFPLIIYLITYFIYQTLTYFSFFLLSIWKYSLITILFNTLNILFIILFNISRTLDGIFILIASSQVLCSIILSIYLPKFRLIDLNQMTIKKLLIDGLNVFGWSLFKDLIYKIDIFLFANRISQTDFGVYTVLRDLLYSVWKVTDPIISSLTKAYSEHNTKILQFMKYIVIYSVSTIFLSPMIVFLIILYSKYYLHIDISPLISRGYIVFFTFSILFFVLWKAIASLYVINKINKPVYVSLFLFFLVLVSLYRFISDLNFVFLTMSLSYIAATIYLINSFNKFNLKNQNEKNHQVIIP